MQELIGDCVLYLGDCMDIMPTLGKVDSELQEIIKSDTVKFGKLLRGCHD